MKKTSRVAIVTGGSYGIGKVCSAILAESGMNVAILSRKRKEGLEAVDELRRFNIKAIHIETDVSDKERVKKSIAQVINEFQRIDVLVNNAGIISSLKYFFEQTDEDWDQVIKTNLYGTFYMMKEVAPIMIKQKYGRIINISSGAARSGSCGRANYAVSKSGIEMLAMTAAKELGEFGITVNVIRPTFTVTPLTLGRGYDFDAIAKKIPRQRVAVPEDVARMVGFLVKEESEFITGQIIAVDGGWGLSMTGLTDELTPLRKMGSNSGGPQE
jgi:3-oxoacyl-[acyl-carrier protein] reductase